MFFKRLLGPSNHENSTDDVKSLPFGPTMTTSATSPSLPAGVQLMSADLQRKLNSKAIQYNMKVVIRGDRNVGKTSLFRRIQGLDFVEDYSQTEQIQVAHIQWTYKASDDAVKVEVWDVVDKGKPRQKLDGLKLTNEEKQIYASASLDAEFIDVYKGAHCVIFMFDITKLWTFEYVEREIQRVPAHLPVLILANHADQSHHRTVPPDRARVFAETTAASRPPGGPPIMACEASMRNSFGLKFVHAFLGVPFLVMQRNTLATLMERNATELEAMHDELAAMLEDPNQSYEAFSDAMASRRREKADSLSPAVALEKAGAVAPTPPQPPPPPPPQMVAGLQVPPSAAAVVETIKQTLGVSAPAATVSPPTCTAPTMVAMTGVGRGQPIVVPPGASSLNTTPTITTTTSKISPTTQMIPPSLPTTTPASSSSIFSKVFRGASHSTPEPVPVPKPAGGGLGSVDDFVPDSSNVDSFLSDEPPPPTKSPSKKSGGFMASVFGSKPKPQPAPPPVVQEPKPAPAIVKKPPPPVDSDEEEGSSRPQIAGFNEDIDLDDMTTTVAGVTSNDEDDHDVVPPVPDTNRPLPNRPLEDYDYADDDFTPAAKQVSPRSSRSSSSQQPPEPPPFIAESHHGRTSSSAEPPPFEEHHGRTSSNTALPPPPLHFEPYPASNESRSPAASFSSSLPVPAPQQQGAASPSSNRSRSSSSLQPEIAAVSEEIEPDQEQRSRVSSGLVEEPAAVPIVPVDFDFALLEQKTMAKPPPQPEEPLATKKKTTKKSPKKSTAEGGKKTTKTKKSAKKQSSLVVEEAEEVAVAAQQKPQSKPAVKTTQFHHQTSAPGPVRQGGDARMEQNDEDDLESFLNS